MKNYRGQALIRVPKPKTAATVMGGLVTLALMIGCLMILMAM